MGGSATEPRGVPVAYADVRDAPPKLAAWSHGHDVVVPHSPQALVLAHLCRDAVHHAPDRPRARPGPRARRRLGHRGPSAAAPAACRCGCRAVPLAAARTTATAGPAGARGGLRPHPQRGRCSWGPPAASRPVAPGLHARWCRPQGGGRTPQSRSAFQAQIGTVVEGSTPARTRPCEPRRSHGCAAVRHSLRACVRAPTGPHRGHWQLRAVLW